MKTKIIAGAGLSVLVLLGTGMALAQPGAARPGGKAEISRADLVSRLDTRFARLDVNGDGNLSAADREKSVEARFKRLDADGNGAITLAEMKAGESARHDGHAASGEPGRGGGAHRGRGRGGSGGPGMGQRADSNGDGIVSKAEFETTALAGFDRADADHNGVLTAAERHQAQSARRP